MEELPQEFDIGFYREFNHDISSLSDDDLRIHYEKYGRLEGRVTSKYSLRENLSELNNGEIRILEIGPFCNPFMTGKNVKYFDVLDKNELIERAKRIKVDHKKCPSIHYVEKSGDLSCINEKFDLIISSHSIEHSLDFVDHLNQVENLLEKNGRYVSIVPDKRYTFDHFLPITTIDHILDRHNRRVDVHDLANVVQHRSLTTHNEPARHWLKDNRKLNAIDIVSRIEKALDEWNDNIGHYIDVHAWYFIPESFRQNIFLLNKLGLTSFVPERVYSTPQGRSEFVAVLTFGDYEGSGPLLPLTEAVLTDQMEERYLSLRLEHENLQSENSLLMQKIETLENLYDNIIHSKSYTLGFKILAPFRYLKNRFS